MEILPIGTQFEGYLQDESRQKGRADFIAFPENEDQLWEALQFAEARGLSVTPQGARTGLTGGAVPRGGLILNLSRLNRILDAEGEGLLRVQAGVSLEQIETQAAALGRFFPPNPTEATATIGGVFAAGAAGPSSLRYGPSSHYVQALSWLTAEGTLWEIQRGRFVFDETGCDLPNGGRLEGRALRTSPLPAFGDPYPGLDLIDFLAGSGGRWGLAAELSLRLLPLPSQSWGVVYFFTETETALAFGEALHRRLEEDGAVLSCAEFLNGESLSRIAPEKLGLPAFPQGAGAAVYTELAGEKAEVLEFVLAAHLDLFAGLGENEDNTWAEQGPSGLRRFRGLRHAAPSIAGEAAGFRGETGALSPRVETDFSGPSALAADYVRMYQSGLREAGLSGLIYGGLLQNRLHTAILCTGPQEQKRAEQLIRSWLRRLVKDGGTLQGLSGPEGLKQGLAGEFFSAEQQAQRKKHKDCLDPQGRWH